MHKGRRSSVINDEQVFIAVNSFCFWEAFSLLIRRGIHGGALFYGHKGFCSDERRLPILLAIDNIAALVYTSKKFKFTQRPGELYAGNREQNWAFLFVCTGRDPVTKSHIPRRSDAHGQKSFGSKQINIMKKNSWDSDGNAKKILCDPLCIFRQQKTA